MYNRTFRGRGQQSKFVHPEDLLEDGLYELGLDEQLAGDDRLMEYITELMNWNRIYNLTSGRKPTEIVTRHILDSLTVLPYLHGRRILDIGTGAGLPYFMGVPGEELIWQDPVPPGRDYRRIPYCKPRL